MVPHMKTRQQQEKQAEVAMSCKLIGLIQLNRFGRPVQAPSKVMTKGPAIN
jgi:hypothetical protein